MRAANASAASLPACASREICMGGLGEVRLVPSAATPRWPWTIVGALLAAGHCLPGEPICRLEPFAEEKANTRSSRSAQDRPARWRDENRCSPTGLRRFWQRRRSWCIESNRPPPATVVAKVAQDCGVEAEDLTIIFAPTQSLAGSTQIVARALEVALHKTARTAFPARARRRRHGRGAAVSAASGFRHRDGPNERRHHLRRTGAAVRHRPGRTRRARWPTAFRAKRRATTAGRLRKFLKQ